MQSAREADTLSGFALHGPGGCLTTCEALDIRAHPHQMDGITHRTGSRRR
jgi:hypothetical protein